MADSPRRVHGSRHAEQDLAFAAAELVAAGRVPPDEGIDLLTGLLNGFDRVRSHAAGDRGNCAECRRLGAERSVVVHLWRDRWLACSGSISRVIGSPADFARRGPLASVHPADRVAALRAFAETWTGRRVRGTLDLRVLGACGAHHVLETTFVSMVSVTGQRSVVAFGLDVADRRADAVRLREFVSRLNGAIMVVDTAGYVRLTNDALAHLFGDRASRWTHQHEGAARDALAAMCRDPARAGERLADLAWAYESHAVRLDLADGRTVEVHRAPLAEAGLGLGALWQFRDVTEEEVVHAGRREPAESSGRLLASVSAVLRGPLAAVANSAEVLADAGAERLGGAERQATLVITSNTRRLLSIVDDLQLLSQLDSGRFSPRREVLRLPELVDSATDAWQTSANTAGIALTCRTRQGAPAVGDTRSLRRVLDNLLHNALKFSTPGSAVVVSARPGTTQWTVEVTDGGIGIPDAEVELVTRAFERASNAVTAGIPGVGLGLALCKKLVESQHGTLTIASTVGEGTTVRITLPGPDAGSHWPRA